MLRGVGCGLIAACVCACGLGLATERGAMGGEPPVVQRSNADVQRDAWALSLQGRQEDALGALDALLATTENDSTRINAWRLKGQILLGMGQSVAALQAYERALGVCARTDENLRSNPTPVSMIVKQIGTLYVGQQRYADADRAFSVLTEQPAGVFASRDVAEAILSRAQVALLMDDADGAERMCDRLDALRLDPDERAAMARSADELRTLAAQASGDQELYVARLEARWAARDDLGATQVVLVGRRLLGAYRARQDVDGAATFAIEFVNDVCDRLADVRGVPGGKEQLEEIATDALEWVARGAWRHGDVARSIEAISLLVSAVVSPEGRRLVESLEEELIEGLTH